MPFALFVASCGGDDDTTSGPAATSAASDDTSDDTDNVDTDDTRTDGTEPPAADLPDLPAACVGAPIEIELTMSGVAEYGGPFTVDSAFGVATPIVPNGDGSLDDLEPSEFNELGAETDLLLYTQWVGDHPFGRDDIGFFSGPEAPDGKITLGLTVVPTSSAGLTTGDVIASGDEFEFDSITTFGSVGVFFQPAEGVETSFFVNNLDETQGGTADVLYVDDNWLCVDWQLAGQTNDPEGRYQVSGVVLTALERATTPFT